MRYRLSRLIPVRFKARYGVTITAREVEEGGHGNHFVSISHVDMERAEWWQWRDRVWGTRTIRTCSQAA